MHAKIETVIAGIVRAMPLKRAWCPALRSIRPPKQIWGRIPFTGDFLLHVDKESSFRIHSDGAANTSKLFWRGMSSYEPETMKLWVRLSRRSRSILDVGAQFGLFALISGAVNPSAKILGFEPLTPMLRLFERNIALNEWSHVRAIHAAVSNQDGEVQIYCNGDDLATTSLSPTGRSSVQSVRCLRLASIVGDEHLAPPDLLKVDVEGFEPEVMEGLGSLLASAQPDMIIEVLNDEVGRRVRERLPAGYRFYQINERAGLIPKSDLRRYDRHSRNFFVTSRGLDSQPGGDA